MYTIYSNIKINIQNNVAHTDTNCIFSRLRDRKKIFFSHSLSLDTTYTHYDLYLIHFRLTEFVIQEAPERSRSSTTRSFSSLYEISTCVSWELPKAIEAAAAKLSLYETHQKQLSRASSKIFFGKENLFAIYQGSIPVQVALLIYLFICIDCSFSVPATTTAPLECKIV